jgi:Ser/Thr protein kinase RdoA (MazF antagonist)
MIPTPGQPYKRYGLGAVNYHTGETVVLFRRRKRRQGVAERLQALVIKRGPSGSRRAHGCRQACGIVGGLAVRPASMHQHTADAFSWCFRSWVEKATLAPPRWIMVPHVWERAIELVLRADLDRHAVFIHRDYHPTNVLWHKGTGSGVVTGSMRVEARQESRSRIVGPTSP